MVSPFERFRASGARVVGSATGVCIDSFYERIDSGLIYLIGGSGELGAIRGDESLEDAHQNEFFRNGVEHHKRVALFRGMRASGEFREIKNELFRNGVEHHERVALFLVL